MPRALILGGTGLIGRATARRLLAAGWQVDVTGRDPDHIPPDLTAHGARFLAADRADPAQLRTVLGGGADLLVDCLCYTAADARSLLPLVPQTTSTVVISSKAVYVDAEGRHPNTPGGPDYGGPVSEDQPTMPASDADPLSRDGYGAHKAEAERVLLDDGGPISVLRPSKVHGEGARPPREWLFVKRALDRRPVLLLAHRGAGGDHPSAAVNVAALVEVCARQPGRRLLNAVDPDAPDGLEISRTIARRLNWSWREVLLDDDAPAGLGAHPWDFRPPIVFDMSAAAALGYTPVGNYASTVAAEVDWLLSIAESTPDGWILPSTVDFDGSFDYAAEDAYLAGRP